MWAGQIQQFRPYIKKSMVRYFFQMCQNNYKPYFLSSTKFTKATPKYRGQFETCTLYLIRIYLTNNFHEYLYHRNFVSMRKNIMKFIPLFPSNWGSPIWASSFFHHFENVRTIYRVVHKLLRLNGGEGPHWYKLLQRGISKILQCLVHTKVSQVITSILVRVRPYVYGVFFVLLCQKYQKS